MSSVPPFPPTYAPVRILMLYVTEDCNLRCTYCFVDKKPRHMAPETMRKAIDWFIDRNVSGAHYDINLNFFGGEPFSRLDLMEEAVAYGSQPRPNVSKRIQFSATTNGTIVGPRVERLVRETGMGLLVSLDGGAEASAYRPFLSGRPSYGHVARNLPRLVEWSPEVMVRMTYHPDALDLAGNVRHALALGAPSIALCPVESAPWAEHEEALEAAYQSLAHDYIAEARAGRLLPLVYTSRYLRAHHAARSGAARPPRPCGVGSALMGVDPEGHVMPCHRFLYRPQDRLGTVDQPTMSEERWRYVHLSSGDIRGCDGCVAQPVCGGGCRASALLAGRGLYDTYSGYCITTRAHIRAVHRIYDTLLAERNEGLMRLLIHGQAASPALLEVAGR